MYIGIALQWDYEEGTVQLYIPGYVSAALHSFQHEKPKIPHDSPHPWTQPIYLKKTYYIIKKIQLKNWIKIIKNDLIKLSENSCIMIEP